MDSFFKNLLNHKSIILFIALVTISIFSILFLLYQSLYTMSIIASFEKIPPFKSDIPVYYKGVEIGKSYRKKISDDYKKINVYLKIHKKGSELPENIKAYYRLSITKPYNYIELIYPLNPSPHSLKKGGIISGELPLDIGSFLEKQAEKGAFDNISNDITGLSGNINEITKTISGVLKENRNDIKKTLKNTSQTAENLNKITASLNDVFSAKQVKKDLKSTIANLEKTTSNVETTTANLKRLSGDEMLVDSIDDINAITKNIKDTTENIKNITGNGSIINSIDDISAVTNNLKTTTQNFSKASENIENITKNIDCATRGLKKTVDKADATLGSAHCAIENANHLAEETCELMSKRFLFFRLLFGKPGDCMKNKPCCICK